LRGSFGLVAALDDGSFAVVDLKTVEPHDNHVPLYSRQLHAYVLALECPAQGRFALTPVTTMGLVAYDP
jgi:hypothetical protein